MLCPIGLLFSFFLCLKYITRKALEYNRQTKRSLALKMVPWSACEKKILLKKIVSTSRFVTKGLRNYSFAFRSFGTRE